MDTDQMGMQLHDRSTRGEPLTSEEIRQLETWYAQQDAIEQERLMPQAIATVDVETLQSQIAASLDQLTAVTQRIQQIAAENAALRQENTALQQQLTLPRSA